MKKHKNTSIKTRSVFTDGLKAALLHSNAFLEMLAGCYSASQLTIIDPSLCISICCVCHL